jgi:iron complex transport system permease protein
MSPVAPSAPAAPPRARLRQGSVRGLVALSVLLAAVAVLSLAIGSRAIAPDTVLRVLLHPDGSDASTIVHDLRIPRTVLAIAVGIALGIAGALMQGHTRNPLADPGLLGVNAGAAAAVIVAIALLGLTGITAYVWFAFLGAAIASVVVYAIGTGGRGAATPARLALAGTAITAALTAFTYAVALSDPDMLQRFNQWNVGSLAGRDTATVWRVAPFLLAGIVLALLLTRSLNALALGDDTARALGADVGRTRIAGAVAITLLCGAATAAAGPIVFVGLTIPYVARAIVGPDQRWVLPYSALLGPVLLLGADVVGRVVARPGELEVGIVTAMLGAPVFIALVRRRRIAQL